MTYLSQRTTIIGVGLIGGSLGMAMRSHGLAGEVVGCGRNPAHLEQAVERGAIDRWTTDPTAAIEGSDLVVLAVPLDAVVRIAPIIAPALSPGACITDVGSAKVCVLDALTAAVGDAGGVVGGHPMAGSEKGGIGEARSDLFEGALYFVVPPQGAQPWAVDRVRELARGIGAYPWTVDARQHDRIVAAISHLPHLLAALIVNVAATALDGPDRELAYLAAAGGFRDVTRIASSDPEMWTEIFMHNRSEMLGYLDLFSDALAQARTLLQQTDAEAIRTLLRQAQETRERFLRKSGVPAGPPPAGE